MEKGDRVWYDDDPGRVVKVDGLDVTVDWDDGGRTTVRASDLLTDEEYYEL